MKASECIKLINLMIQEYGDLDVKVFDEYYKGVGNDFGIFLNDDKKGFTIC